jgi:assimilatory nitrate reductase catalytic subunit
VLGLADGDLAEVASRQGRAVLEVRVQPQGQAGVVFAPFHWTAQTSSHGRIGAVTQGPTDPISGQPEMKATPVAIRRVAMASRGFLLASQPVAPPAGSWWAKVTLEGGTGFIYAADLAAEGARAAAGTAFAGLERVEFIDAAAGIYRTAAFRDGQLVGALFHGPASARPHWDAVKALLAGEPLEPVRRRLVLSGKPLDGVVDQGPLVCACFGVGLNIIRDAIAGGHADVEAIGKALKAGTNCGSCVPELRRILSSTLEPA